MYRRQKKPEYAEYNCEDNRLLAIGDETYFLGVDGFLMPIAKGQPAPDLKHFQPHNSCQEVGWAKARREAAQRAHGCARVVGTAAP